MLKGVYKYVFLIDLFDESNFPDFWKIANVIPIAMY